MSSFKQKIIPTTTFHPLSTTFNYNPHMTKVTALSRPLHVGSYGCANAQGNNITRITLWSYIKTEEELRTYAKYSCKYLAKYPEDSAYVLSLLPKEINDFRFENTECYDAKITIPIFPLACGLAILIIGKCYDKYIHYAEHT